jgi:hypothetical protein
LLKIAGFLYNYKIPRQFPSEKLNHQVFIQALNLVFSAPDLSQMGFPSRWNSFLPRFGKFNQSKAVLTSARKKRRKGAGILKFFQDRPGNSDRKSAKIAINPNWQTPCYRPISF